MLGKARKRTLATVKGSAGISTAEFMASGATLAKGRFGVTMWDVSYDINTGQLLHNMKIRLT